MSSHSHLGPISIPPSKRAARRKTLQLQPVLPQPPPPSDVPPSSSPSTTGNKRTSHACNRCRLMRAKCSGGTRCVRCTKDDVVCLYGDHKRERNRKSLADGVLRIKELEDENHDLVAALRSMTVRPDFRPSEYGDILKVLAKYPSDEHGESSESGGRSRSVLSTRSPTTTTDAISDKAGEGRVSSNVGSPGHQGELRRVIDLDHGAGAVGLIGKMSEMSWMQRCREHLVPQPTNAASNQTLPEYYGHNSSASDLTYFMDNVNLLAVDEDHVEATYWPPFDLVVVMAEAYFHAIDGYFEIIHRENFLDLMYNFPRQTPILTWEQRTWLASANLVWAIGLKWLHLANLGFPVAPEDHLAYYARTRALGLDHRMSRDDPSVETVQGMGLLAFYLLINGSITRAWNAIGNAVRHAMTLGLHLRVADPTINVFEQVRRAKTWFSLYKLEMQIAEITGRPQLGRTVHITIPLEILNEPTYSQEPNIESIVNLGPSVQARQVWTNFLQARFDTLDAMSVDDEAHVNQPNMFLPGPRSHFPYCIRLCQLSEDIADQLYTGRQDIPWQETQWKIEELQRALDAWAGTLPEDLRLSQPLRDTQNLRASVHLAMYGHSVSMILHRPCLCEIQIANESDRSKEFNVTSARTCVRAAMAMLELMPDELVPFRIHNLLPWWALVHYVCQAASVLLLELCLDAQHFQGEAGHVMTAMWKAMSYLAWLAQESRSAYKAWRIFDSLLKRVSVRYGGPDLFSASEQPHPPQSWTDLEETSLRIALQG